VPKRHFAGIEWMKRGMDEIPELNRLVRELNSWLLAFPPLSTSKTLSFWTRKRRCRVFGRENIQGET
jgi:hypothetical protein